jgi:hypothetical protein
VFCDKAERSPAHKQCLRVIADVAAQQPRHGLSQACIGYAHRVEIHALAKLGALLCEVEKAKGRPGPGGGKAGTQAGPAFTKAPTLAELGVSKKTSSIAQQLAALPAQTREAIAAHEITLSAVRRTQKAEALDRRLTLPDAKYRVLYVDPPGAREVDQHCARGRRGFWPMRKRRAGRAAARGCGPSTGERRDEPSALQASFQGW